MERTYIKNIRIRDLELEVTIVVKGEKKDRPPLHDEELKGRMVDVRA